MPVQEKDIESDIDSLGDSPIPHRSPEKIETTVLPTLKPEKDGEEDERHTRQRREAPEPEVEKEEEEETQTRKPSRENDELRAAMSELATTVTKVVTEREKPPEKKMTEAEMKAYWKVYTPDPKDIHALFQGLPSDATPEQVTAHTKLFQKFSDGITQQAYQAAYNVLMGEIQKRDARLDQFDGYRSEQTARQVRSDFNFRYESLADAKFDKILKIVSSEIEADKSLTFTSNNQFFDELAKRSAEYIQEIDPDFVLGDAAKTKSTGKLPRLPRSGGGGGTGNTGRDGGKKSKSTQESPGGDIDSLS